jgi:sec-independent protein translocase protein TatA
MTGLMTPTHMLLILTVLLLVFGAKRLPEIGRSLGSGMREFRHSLSGHADASSEPAPEAKLIELPTRDEDPPTGAAA